MTQPIKPPSLTARPCSRRTFLKLTGAAGAAALFPLPRSAARAAVDVAQAKPFTLVVLPDTQCYADTRIKYAAGHWGNGDLRANFYAQTQWVKDNKDKLNIAMVTHVGDIVQTNYPEEWAIADKAFKTLDGAVPYTLCLGNHDMGVLPDPQDPNKFHTATSRKTLLNDYFPPARFENQPWYGGHLGEGNDNYYCLFKGAGMDFLVLSLEFTPRDATLDWANDVMRRHPNHRTIVNTHEYLTPDSIRSDKTKYPVKGNHGEAVWAKFVSRHKNIFLVVCGHYCREGRLTSTGANGNQVHQLLSDYQDMHNGGDGYLRTMTFMPDQNRIDVKTYSPVLDAYLTGPTSQFSIEHAMQSAVNVSAA